MGAESAQLRRWLDSSAKAVKRERERLDAINVFPIADSDTGTNLYLTLQEGNRAVAYLPANASHREVVAAFARGCLMGARGNSGVIVSQYLSAFLAFLDGAGGLGLASGATIAEALDKASRAAYDAVGEPVEGTVLTLARSAAEGAAGAVAVGAGIEATAIAAVVAARAELARTGQTLAQAHAAGVVDAGAAGLLLQLEMLAETIAGPEALSAMDDVEWEMRERTSGLTPAALAAAHEHAQGGGAFEVMFVAQTDHVTGANDGRPLKEALGAIGDSVALTGTAGLWQAHVHTDLPEEAIDVARAVAATQIVVRDVTGESVTTAVGVVALTTCPGLASALAGAGATVLVALDPEVVSDTDLDRVVADTHADRVVIVGGTGVLTGAARLLASNSLDANEPHIRVLDSSSEIQVIAALVAAALGSPGDDPEPAMAAAVARCRSSRAMLDTIVDDLERLLSDEVEVATIIVGDTSALATARAAAASLRERHPLLDVNVHLGGQTAPAVIIGVEVASTP